jgi:hypothetical protein
MDVTNRWKAGSYSVCMSSGCSSYRADFSIAGVLTLPAKNAAGAVVPESYAYSDFVNDLLISCKPGGGCPAEEAAYAAVDGVVDEAARTAIDGALRTWPRPLTSGG